MPPKHVAPSIELQAFNCPVCGALADQAWFHVRADATHNGEPPGVITHEFLDQVKRDYGNKEEFTSTIARFERAVLREPFLDRRDKAAYDDFDVVNLQISKCRSCKDISIWRYDTLLYPPSRYDVEPNDDLPLDVKADFEEARTILDLSPRGAAALLRLAIQKLCKHLKQTGEHINADIAALVKAGLDPKIQKALDIVRVVGNQAVHPGTLDLNDNREIAAKLFDLVNLIAYELITKPQELEALFVTAVPERARQAIAKRDGEAK